MTTLAVIPILVQTGTTLLSTILAGAGTFLAPLFRGPEWLRWCRRRPVAAAVLIVGVFFLSWEVVALTSWLTRPARSRTDWTQVGINLIRSEQNAIAAQSKAAAPRHLRLAWEFKVPGASFLSRPIVANGRLYAASCLVDVSGTFGSIFCLDAATGRLIWQVDKIEHQDLKGFFSSPAISANGNFLVIGEGLHFDTGCHLFCLEAGSGKMHWKIDIPKNHVESSPALLGDVVTAGAGAIEYANHLPVESPGYVLSVRVSDGKVRWHNDVVDPESSPAMGRDGTVYIGSGVNGCAMVAFSSEGRPLWKTPTPYPAIGAVVLSDDLALVGTGRGDFVNADPHPVGAVLAFDRTTGRIRWQIALPDAVLGDVALAGSELFCPVRDGTVVALDRKTGKKIWSQRISRAPVLAGVTASGDCLYAVSSDGFLVVLERKTGHTLEKQVLNDETNPGRRNLSICTPLVRDGRVFVGSETGGLRCFVGTVKP